MKTFIAGVERAWHWRIIKDGAVDNVLCSFAAAHAAKVALDNIICVSIVDIPDELGEAFLATGLPQTCEVLKKWLKERGITWQPK